MSTREFVHQHNKFVSSNSGLPKGAACFLNCLQSYVPITTYNVIFNICVGHEICVKVMQKFLLLSLLIWDIDIT